VALLKDKQQQRFEKAQLARGAVKQLPEYLPLGGPTSCRH